MPSKLLELAAMDASRTTDGALRTQLSGMAVFVTEFLEGYQSRVCSRNNGGDWHAFSALCSSMCLKPSTAS